MTAFFRGLPGIFGAASACFSGLLVARRRAVGGFGGAERVGGRAMIGPPWK